MFEVNTKQLREAMIRDFKVGLVPMVASSPGMGKSDVVKSIAEEFKLKLIDLRVSQCEPVDMKGFPDTKDDRMAFLPPKYFPLSTDPIPTGYSGWLLFLDEFNSASREVEGAAYRLILDRTIEEHSLHPKCVIAAAGNLVSDRAIVNVASTATTSRLSHYRLIVDCNIWVEWANLHNIDHRIISFIKFKPSVLHKFNPDTDELTFPCPRTFEFASKVISNSETIDTIDKIRLAGTIGEGTSIELVTYCEIYQSLPTIEQILNDPKTGWKVPTEISEQYAITTMLSHNITKTNVDIIMTAIERLPIEFQVITLKDIYSRQPDLKDHLRIQKWVSKHASEMF